MPTQVLKPAPGFLGMLDAQQMGRNPSRVTDEVLPNVDMLPFWMAQRHTIDTIIGANVIAPSGVATVGVLTVPDGEAWIPLRASVRGVVESLNAAYGLQLSTSFPARQSPQSASSNTSILATSPSFSTTVVDDQPVSLEYTWHRAEVRTAGSRFTGLLLYVNATGTTFNSNRFVLEYLAFPA